MRLLISLALLLLAAQLSHGQGASPSRSGSQPSDTESALNEAKERLRKAKQNVDIEKAREAASGALQKLPTGVTDAAKDALKSEENRTKMMDAAKSAAETLLPEAQRLLKEQTGSMPAPAPSVAPQPSTPAVSEPALPAPAPLDSVVGPKPQPLQPLAAAPGPRKTTVVIEADDAVFDPKSAIIIYTGHVRARHPQFYIECEKLEVHMVKDEEEAAAKKAAAKKDAILADQDSDAKNSRIKMAIASGPMVTIEKLSETDGEIQQGKCKRAVYRSSTGEIVMSDYPQVQRGNILHIATQPDTEMIFEQNGKLRTTGRPRTVILQGDDARPVSKGGLLPRAIPIE